MVFPDGWAKPNAADEVTGVSPNRGVVVQLRGTKRSAAEAARRSLAQDGVQTGATSTGTIHGNRAVTAEFASRGGQNESVRRVVTFIDYGRATWGILSYTRADQTASLSPAFSRSRESSQRLTHPAALAVQPLCIRIDRAPRAMSLQQFNSEMSSTIPLAELALLNGLDETSQSRAGQPIKRVTGTVMAHAN
jgi:predicted Zn-dependent protease